MKNTNKTMGKTITESVGVTETQEISLGGYERAWQSHVRELNLLRWNLPKQDDRIKLERIQVELNELIDVAKADLKNRREE